MHTIMDINCRRKAYLEKHKNKHNRRKIGEIPKCIMNKFWSIIDSSLIKKHWLKLMQNGWSKAAAMQIHFDY